MTTMGERERQAARLLEDKLGMPLPAELLVLALGQLGRPTSPAAAQGDPHVIAAAPIPDARPLAGLFPPPPAPAATSAPSMPGDDDLAALLPLLARHLGGQPGSGGDRRAELATAAALIGKLLGGGKPSS